MALNFRTLYKWLVPGWLSKRDTDGEKVLYSLSLMLDAFQEKYRQGLNARFPSRTGPSSVALIAQDRGLTKGRTETAEHFAERLIHWRYPRGHRVRGNAFALLEQIAEYFGGMKCWTIDVKGKIRKREEDGTESKSSGNAWDWDGAGVYPNHSRFWIVLEPSATHGIDEHPDFGEAALWGGALGEPGYTVGQTGVTPDDANAIFRLFRGRPWKPAGTRAEWIIVSLDGTVPAPDGTWLHWSKNDGGTQVAARDPALRYWSLTPEANNDYAGDSANWPDLMTLVDGSTYAGDSSSFSADITLPDGSTYAGDSASFPSEFRLVDDAGIPV